MYDAVYYSPIDNNYYLSMNEGDGFKFGHLQQLDSKVKFYPKGIKFERWPNRDMLKGVFDDFEDENLGEICVYNNDFYYFSDYLKEPVMARTLSSGLKTILLLKQLLITGEITKNMMVCLDEPEINLHPKWQIYLAKLICNLNKKLNIHFLICSHSPYFIAAIENYSKKLEVDNVCNYYLAYKDANDGSNKILCCTTEIDMIYKSLHSSFGKRL